MASTDGSEMRHSLMDFPAEIRLQIFSYIEDSSLPRSINIAPNCIHRLEPRGCPTLAALSSTCSTIHTEVDDRLYQHRHFNIDIQAADSLMILWRRNFSPDLTFLHRMQSVHLAISLNTASTKLRKVCASIRRVLSVFAASTELRDFTAQIREVFHLAVRHDFVNNELLVLRQEVVAKGLREGRTFCEIEMDVAWKALEFFENGFRLLREGEPCCSFHALYYRAGVTGCENDEDD